MNYRVGDKREERNTNVRMEKEYPEEGHNVEGLFLWFLTLVQNSWKMFKNKERGTSLAVQWLQLHAATVGGHRFDPWWGELRSHMMPAAARKK